MARNKTAKKKSSRAVKLESPSAKFLEHESNLRNALLEITEQDRQLYLERLFIANPGKMSAVKRRKSLDAFLEFASIGFLSDGIFREWAKGGK